MIRCESLLNSGSSSSYCTGNATWKAYTTREVLVCVDCAKRLGKGVRVEEMTQVEVLQAKIADLESREKDHEREKQDAYEQGLMQREGPDDLSEQQQGAWHRLEDRLQSNTCGDLDSDIRILRHALTILRGRLAVRSEQIEDLRSRLEVEISKPIPMFKMDDVSARLLTLEKIVASVRNQRNDWKEFDSEDEISYGYAIDCLNFALDD